MALALDAFYPIPTGWHIGGLDYDIEPPDSPQLDGPSPNARLAPRIPHFPVAALPRLQPAFGLKCFFDDYYFRIHLVPDRVDFGNLATTTAVGITLWNADLAPHTASALSGVPEGLSLTPPDTQPAFPPWDWMPLEEQNWTLTAFPVGAAEINERIVWEFDLHAPPLIVTGNRIQTWPFLPNWADPVTERLAWLTDVLASTSGAEQRRALRQTPRRRLEAAFLTEKEDRSLLDILLAAWGSQLWALPLWPEMQYLKQGVSAGDSFIPCTTANRDFEAGAIAVLIGESPIHDVDTVEVSGVEAGGIHLRRALMRDHPAGTRLYPSRAARLSRQPELTRHTDRLYEFEAAFDVQDAPVAPALPVFQTYRGRPVYLARPDESRELTDSYERMVNLLDVEVGKTRAYDVAKRGFPVRSHHFLNKNLAGLAAAKALLFLLKGRQGAVWLPTHMEDMTPVRTTTDSMLWIRAFGYARYGVGRLGRQDVAIQLRNGQTLLRRITEASEEPDDPAIERIRVEPTLPKAYPPSEIARISYLALMRLADDDVEIEHLTADDGISRLSLTFRAIRDDLEATS